MANNEKGFKLVESLVVIGILAILVICFFPWYIRGKDKARVAEVKSNIHSMQIACERYAVDSGGLYPLFLVGGERDYNILQASIDMSGNGISRFPVDGVTPFAMAPDGPDRTKMLFTMDPLIHYGYLSEYPQNPFTRSVNSINFFTVNEDGLPGEFPYGGLSGNKMFDLGFGWGDTPQTDFIANNFGGNGPIPDLDAPGNFYYHPIFHDSRPAYWHYAMQFGMNNMSLDPDTAFNLGIYAHEPVGYYIYGYGSSVSSGQGTMGNSASRDYLTPMPDRNDLPLEADLLLDQLGGRVLNSSVVVEGRQEILESSGYLASEYNPWIEDFPEDVEFEDPRQTGKEPADAQNFVHDWVIVSVIWGGSVVIEEFSFKERPNDIKIQSDQEDTPERDEIHFAT